MRPEGRGCPPLSHVTRGAWSIDRGFFCPSRALAMLSVLRELTPGSSWSLLRQCPHL